MTEEVNKEHKKKHKKRMKAIYTKIREQMEFYFSDSNLARDRFMKQLIDKSQDGYADISVFLNFNKIKAITTEVEVIRKALSHSTFFQFNEDKTKVKRSKPFSEPKSLDDRIVYVECLPHKVDHEWIKNVFSSCGKVNYVSLPKYKSTGDPKGFAFVEFETRSEAEKACQELNNPPAEMLERPGRFPRSNKQIQYLQERIGDLVTDKDTEEVSTTGEKKTSEGLSEEKKSEDKLLDSPSKSRKARKRRRQTSESSVDGTAPVETLKKRRSTQSSEAASSEDKLTKDSSESDSSSRKKRKSAGSRDSIEGTSEHGKPDNVDRSENQTKGKKRRHESGSQTKGKEADDRTLGVDKEESEESDSKKRKVETDETSQKKTEGDNEKTSIMNSNGAEKKKTRRHRKKKNKDKGIPELRVIPKKEWLSLRNEYLSLQKKSMKELKKTLVQLKKEGTEDKSQATKEKPIVDESQAVEVPGVVVRVKNTSPFTRNQLREDLGTDVNVAYIDANDGDSDGYIRFKDSQSATTVADSKNSSYVFTLLTGDEELSYWKKLHADRAAKRNVKVKKKKNGQQKLIDRAQKINKENVERVHIKFDE